jgi:hypothetical protein
MKSLHEEITNTALAAGANTLSSSAPGPARIRRITDVAFSYTGTVAGVRMEVKAGGISVYKTIANPTSGQLERIANMGNLYLSAGEKIELVVTGATLNDDAALDIHGEEEEA